MGIHLPSRTVICSFGAVRTAASARTSAAPPAVTCGGRASCGDRSAARMAVVVPAMSRRRGRLSTAETWVVVGREAEAVGSARCGAPWDEGDLAAEVGSFGEIVSIGSGIERKPILEQDLESADCGQDSELLQGGAVRLGSRGVGDA
jgi:hypothetical protein